MAGKVKRKQKTCVWERVEQIYMGRIDMGELYRGDHYFHIGSHGRSWWPNYEQKDRPAVCPFCGKKIREESTNGK